MSTQETDSIGVVRAALNRDLINEMVWKARAQDGLKPAAVLFPIYRKEGEWRVLLTQRTEHLRHHSGQISFPGGAFEHQDKNIRATALRETTEEVGIIESQIQILGHLDDEFSISRFRVTPFVGRLEDDFDYKISTDEVASVFGVPLAFFTDESNRQVQYYKSGEERHKFYVFQYKKHTIWGLTAKIIVQLVDRIKRDQL
ncbi:CoA pyrophosphatase [Marinicella sp. W31]|uniref:CoA pyrophosphatase n=1 Tax=Marinicella sp. W31 TaxID=3023713 RepID=UPI003756EFC5